MAQGGNSDLSLRHNLFRAFWGEADQSRTHAGEISDVLTSSVLHHFSIDYEDVAG
jgi:hypothetical protein